MNKLLNKIVSACLSSPKLRSVQNKKSGVEVSWRRAALAQGYYIWRKKGMSGEWEKISDVDAKKRKYVDHDVKSGKGYRYNVSAYRDEIEADCKTQDGIWIRYLSSPQTKGIAWSPKSGVTIKWKRAKGADGYYVYRKTNDGEWKKIAKVGANEAKGEKNDRFSFTDRTAQKRKKYEYSIKAYKGKTMSARATKGLKIKTK